MWFWFCDICLLTTKFGLPWMVLCLCGILNWAVFSSVWSHFLKNLDFVLSFGVLWRPRFCRRCYKRSYTATRNWELPALFIRAPVSALFTFWLLLTGTFCLFRCIGPFQFCVITQSRTHRQHWWFINVVINNINDAWTFSQLGCSSYKKNNR